MQEDEEEVPRLNHFSPFSFKFTVLVSSLTRGHSASSRDVFHSKVFGNEKQVVKIGIKYIVKLKHLQQQQQKTFHTQQQWPHLPPKS